MKRLLLKPMGFALGACLLLSACSKVDSNDLKEEIPYYQEYEVSYDKATNKTKASASYKIRSSSGARVELTNNAGVTLNGINGETSLTDKTTYKWDISGLQDANFVLTKNSGVTISNSVAKSTSINDIEITNLPDSISKAAGFSFTWMGAALNSGESIRAIISSTIGGITLYSKDVSGTTVSFSSTELTTVPAAGSVRVTLKRQKEIPLQNQDENAGGKITISLETTKETRVVN